jgi:hypothetical protein
MSTPKASKRAPGKISVPFEDWNEDSALLTHTPSPAPSNGDNQPEPNPFSSTAFSPGQWNVQQDGLQNPFTGDEPPEIPEIPDKAPIPVALPMSSVAGVTPLPLLPMTVLSIVSNLDLYSFIRD